MESIGKRPDILLFPTGIMDEDDVSTMSMSELGGVVGGAVSGIEIRSSSFLAKKYRQKNLNEPKKFLSFTPKLEDIRVVLKWIETYDVPHYYAQVFFDEVHMISFRSILETIRDHECDKEVYTVEKNARNQLKTTIHVNISQGTKIGEIRTPPIPRGKRVELDSAGCYTM